jgi:rubrerythrin
MSMTEPTRRPILRLKNPPPAAKTPRAWRCKPCGAPVEIAATLADDGEVRCPACNALLGTAHQFRSDPPQLQRIRARLVGG